MGFQRNKRVSGKAVRIILTVVLLLLMWKIQKAERLSAADITYAGSLSSPRGSYELVVGDFVVDGSNVWTIEEAEEISGMGGLICTWTHDGKSEILADYQPVKYPGYRHFSMNEEVFGAGYIIISGQQNTIYYSYNDFRNEVGKLYKSVGASGFKAYNIYYAKKEGKTSFIYQNGNLKLEIPITVSVPKGKPVQEVMPEQNSESSTTEAETVLPSLREAEQTQQQTQLEPQPHSQAQNNQGADNNSGSYAATDAVTVAKKNLHMGSNDGTEQGLLEGDIYETDMSDKPLNNPAALVLTGVVLACGGVVLFARRKF